MVNCRNVHYFIRKISGVSVKKSETSRVILTNHAYLLTRLEDDKEFTSKSVLVVDEAQKLFFALEQFSQREKKPCNLFFTSLQYAIEGGKRSSAATIAEYSI